MTGQDVGALLRSLREDKGESLRQTASNVGVAPSQLSRMERNQRSLGSTAERLADYYSVPVARLIPAGLPPDIVAILQQNPEEIDSLRSKYHK